MKYVKLKPKLGDVIAISDDMALKYEKIADDIAPVWMEIPVQRSTVPYSQGTYVTVTEDLWFIYDHDSWRVMTMNEHTEANRQSYFNDLLL